MLAAASRILRHRHRLSHSPLPLPPTLTSSATTANSYILRCRPTPHPASTPLTASSSQHRRKALKQARIGGTLGILVVSPSRHFLLAPCPRGLLLLVDDLHSRRSPPKSFLPSIPTLTAKAMSSPLLYSWCLPPPLATMPRDPVRHVSLLQRYLANTWSMVAA